MRVLRASERALLVEAADLEEAMRLNAAWKGLPGVVELVPGARTVLVHFDPLRVSATELAARLVATGGVAASAPPTGEVVIPVRYDGDDLAETAARLGISAEALVARHLAAHWQVAFSGFAPGFGYIVGDDPFLDVPRRATPRTRVPAGSVALAGRFTGVYPRETPGGWQLIGRTDAVLWDASRDPAALLSPGTAVQFARAQRVTLTAAPSAPPVPSPPVGARSVEVMHPGLQTLIEDAGRPGHAALGVSASGAADRVALRDANRAVGNPFGAAALEIVGAAVLRFGGDGVAAVTGAYGDLALVDADGFERPAAHSAPFATFDGDELHLGHPTAGLRRVVAVRGGIDIAPTLGSRSTDTLAGLGPDPLRAGSIVGVGDGSRGAVDPYPASRVLPAPGALVELAVVLGPRDDWFTASALSVLAGQEWEVTSQSDRVGIRLHGELPLERVTVRELPSEGAVTGAVQVPPDGQPVIFLPDHPLTAGYPIIAALTDDALSLAAQTPPGCRIRFRIIETRSSGILR